jgi:predicted O-methyltransferase YrrM
MSDGSKSALCARTQRIHDQIETIYREGTVLGEDGIRYPVKPTSVTPERGAFIRELCQREQARTTLEIGMAWGLSTLFMLEALAASDSSFSHTVIDPFQSSQWHGAGRRAVQDTGLAGHVTIFEEFSRIALARMEAEHRQFEFIFVDGGHRFEDVFVDLIFADRILKPGGLMIFDDSWFDPVFLTCRFAETNYGYSAAAEYPKRSADRRRPRRATMRALRKPNTSRKPGSFDFAPFFNDFAADRSVEHSRLAERGLDALRRGDRAAARHAFIQMLRIDPYRVKTYSRLMRSFLPTGLAARLSSHTRKPSVHEQ